MPPLDILGPALALLVAAIAIPIERRAHEIPNWLTFCAFLLAWPIAFFSGTLERAAVGFALTLFVALLGFRRGVVGGGALKLAVAVSALSSWHVSAALVALVGAWLAAGFVLAKREHPARAEKILNPVQGSPIIAVATVLGLVALKLWP